MAVGDVINYANYKAIAPTSWSLNLDWTDENKTIYLSACSFVLKIKVTSVWFRKSRIWLTSYYYNGSAWVQAYTGYLSESGGSSNEAYFYHNRSTEGSTTEDQPQHHLWKFVIEMDPEGSSHGYFNIWAGGLEMMSETEYNTNFKGEKLQGIRCVWGDELNYIDSTWISSWHSKVNKGTPISISSGTYKWLGFESD